MSIATTATMRKMTATSCFVFFTYIIISISSNVATASSLCESYGPVASKACGEISVGAVLLKDLARDCEGVSNTEWAWCLAIAAENAGIIDSSLLSEADKCLEDFSCSCNFDEFAHEDRDRSLQSNCDPPAPAPAPGVCFSGSVTVQVLEKGQVPMRDLQVGDKVLSGYSNHYQPVYAFGHKLDQPADFLSITFETATAADQHPLEITGDHLVFVQGRSNPVRADSIQVGDVLQAAEPFGDDAKVKFISKIVTNGLYAPLTPDGTLIANGIRASSYISLQENADEHVQLQGGLHIISQHAFIHMALSPFRLLCMVHEQTCQSYDTNGMPNYVSKGIRLAKWFDSLNLNIVLQVILLALFVMVFTSSMLLETFLTQAPMTLAVFSTGLGVLYLLKNGTKRTGAKQKVSLVLFGVLLVLLPIRQTLALCGADGPQILQACGNTVVLTDPPTTLNQLSLVGNCERHQGLLGWFHCIHKTAQSAVSSNTGSDTWMFLRSCIANEWGCPEQCESQGRRRVQSDDKFLYDDDDALCPTPAPVPSAPVPAPVPSAPVPAPAPVSAPTPGTGCFSGTPSVQVLGRGPVPMKELVVGDKVLTSAGTYESVYAFAQLDKNRLASFVRIETEDNETTLEVSGHHLLFLKSKRNPVRADSIMPGDILDSSIHPNGSLVRRTSTIHGKGFFSPLTPSGTLLVENIKVSSYTSLQPDAIENIELEGGISTGISQHDMIHMTLSPFRILCNYARDPFEICQSYSPENGKVYYVDYGLRFARWARGLGIFTQVALFIVFTLTVGAFSIAELFLGLVEQRSFTVLLILLLALGSSTTWCFRARRSKLTTK